MRRLQKSWGRLQLRNRLTAAVALAAAVAIVGVVAVAYVAVRHELLSQVDSQLRHEAREVKPNVLRGADLRPQVGEAGGCLQVITSFVFWTAPRPGCQPLPVTAADYQIAHSNKGQLIRTVELRGVPYRMITEPVPDLDGRAVQIALPLSSVSHQLYVLRTLFLLLILLGLGLVAGGTWLVVRRTMRPVRALTDAAHQITVTRDLSTRIDAYDDDELGRLAASFNLMLDALQVSLTQQRQLVLDASHELRTPLASLRTNTELLNQIDAMTPEQRRATLDGIVAQLDELTLLVADVVELARGEAPPDTHDDVAFDELVLTAVDRSRRHWREITFEVDAEPVTVRGTAARLDRAVANLLDNAGKFSEPGGAVQVKLDRHGVLMVADRGRGIPSEALPHVFDRFYRADVARALPGSGLGLAIVKQIIDGHGGRVEIAQRPGGGTIARVQLPVVEPAVPDDPAAAAGADDSGSLSPPRQPSAV